MNSFDEAISKVRSTPLQPPQSYKSFFLSLLKSTPNYNSKSIYTSYSNSDAMPLSLLFLPLLASLALYFQPSTSPTKNPFYMSESAMFDLFTFKHQNHQVGTSKLVVSLALFLPPFLVLVVRITSYLRARKLVLLSFSFLTLILFSSSLLIFANTQNFLYDAIAMWQDDVRYCVLSTHTPTSTTVENLLLKSNYKPTNNCDHANLIFAPVPWLDRSLIEGTIFGGVSRNAR